MPQAAKYWRPDGGYQDAPQVMADCVCVPNFPSPWMNQPGPWQGFTPNYIQGPIYINGLSSPPLQYGQVVPPPPTPVQNLAPPPQEEKKEEAKKEETKKENPRAPPKMPEGCNYMFDRNHTMLHIFSKTHPVWEEKYKDSKKKFKMFKVSVNFTVKMVIENVLRKEGDDCKGWAATEAVELGGGKWAKGSTIEYDNSKSDGKLKEMAWTTKRGDSLPPVWLVVHKV